MDKVIIKNLLVYSILGINPDERVKRQPIVINLVLETDIKKAATSDKIEDAVNYSKLSELIITHVEASSDLLIEKLITDIARLIFAEFLTVQKATIRIEKPSASRFAESVGIEIERTRDSF
ncbi:MAG: dihydroneopterin aldolase [Moorea sp. SIO2B7]|nr:dihydroneopterin aldolase [Moorena sp. SIO2B7]